MKAAQTQLAHAEGSWPRQNALEISSGFDAVASATARVLILGSLPGRVSLEKRQYYAQPQNAFWRLMGQQFDFRADLPYSRRLGELKKNRIALWDVCASAHRPGSLDAAIDTATVRPNDFAAFFARHRAVSTVFFNCGKAESLYKRLVLPILPADLRPLTYTLLPSTSPAHASLSMAAKLRCWSSLRSAIEP
jgi:double-stranded uracil-DNA glycosylase